MHLILPKARPVLHGSPKLERLPLFFLAGPIQGGGDWHLRLSVLLASAVGDCLIVNPSRYDDTHPHFSRKLEGPVLDDNQTDWEAYYLEQAGRKWRTGCIIFWLAVQVAPRETGSYARDTRGELAEWRTHRSYDSTVRLVVGAEEGFDGLKQVRRNFDRALGPGFPIYSTMADVVEAAKRYALPSGRV